ncbi:MAG: hypothetical protein O9345_04385 [Burkholderiaceae bacterium]|jgi:hypothetical protein|nr:hypothetical protein [Acidobacteriaceae bacterium]MCZ8098152.1 hypothetical protein [Burkholderiales bacterium]MCZ8337382.1 hypothetical protein [Burkholderiaceae bacterium]
MLESLTPEDIEPEAMPAIVTLLNEPRLRVAFSSPKEDYRIEYTTTIQRDRVTKAERLNRVCRLHDELRGGIMVDPWGPFELEKQARIVSNLLRFTDYRITEASKGWKAVCGKCGTESIFEVWQTVPKACKGSGTKKCGATFKPTDVVEMLIPVDGFPSASSGIDEAS